MSIISREGHKRFFADMGALWQQDLANVEAGVYPLPADHDGSLKMLLQRSRLFLPAVHRRRESGDHSEVLSEETRGKRPRYYLQNFQSWYRSSIMASASLLRAPLGRPGSPLLPGKKRGVRR